MIIHVWLVFWYFTCVVYVKPSSIIFVHLLFAYMNGSLMHVKKKKIGYEFDNYFDIDYYF
jgi:hypothetical protein